MFDSLFSSPSSPRTALPANADSLLPSDPVAILLPHLSPSLRPKVLGIAAPLQEALRSGGYARPRSLSPIDSTWSINKSIAANYITNTYSEGSHY